MRPFASFLVFFLLVSMSYAQDSSQLKIMPLDEDAILERLEDHNKRKLEIVPQETDSIENINDQYSMRIYDVDESNMAKMPMMEIKEDMHYTMQIKKYTNYYGKFVNKDSLEQRKKRVLPLKPKEWSYSP